MELIPQSIEELIKNKLGDEADLVLEEVERTIKLEFTTPPLVKEGKTQGDWTAMLPDFTDDHRPHDALSFEIIQQMTNSSPVRFAFEMKRSQIIQVFRNQRSWKVQSPDTELSEIATANLIQILPKMSLDFSYSSLIYGVSFQELVWEYKSKYELGITDSRHQSNKKFVVAKIPNAVNPVTVPRIKRDKKGHFNGFVQRPKLGYPEIEVGRDSSLIIPYNERFRNLWGESFLKPIYPIWFWYEVVLRSMVRYMERTGTPVALVKAPSRATVLKPGTATKVNAMTWGMEIASNIARSNAAVIPSDTDEKGQPLWDMNYMSSNERSQPFMDILELLTQMILRAGLTADRAISQSSGGVGSYNIGEVHKEATALHNESILIQWLHYLNTYFLPLFSLYNRGSSGPPIWLETQGLDPTDRSNLTTLLGVAQNMESFKEIGFRIDWETLLATNDIPLIDESEAKAKKDELKEESLSNQEATMEMQKKYATPPPAKNNPVKPNNQQPIKQEEEYELPDIDYYTKKKVAMATVAALQLYNPYHDELGRFTNKPTSGSAALFGIGSGKSDFNLGPLTRRIAEKTFNRASGNLQHGTTKPKITSYDKWTDVAARTGFKSKNILGAFVSDTNEIVITPAGLGLAAKDRRFIDVIITHETIHARKRSSGNNIQFTNTRHALLEEGLTELIGLSPRNNTSNYKYSASPYLKQMQAVATEARRASGGDVSKAWSWITQSHYYNDNPSVARSRYDSIGDSLWKGTGRNSDIDWLFSLVPKKLEEVSDEDFAKEMKKSEIDKWKELGIEISL